MLEPSGLIREINPGSYNIHPHIPGFGGEIAFNDIEAIKTINGMIKLQNQEIAAQYQINLGVLQSYRDIPFSEYESLSNEDKFRYKISKKLIPYVLALDPSGYPSEGYNMHDHSNMFNGGAIVGAGFHTHQGVGNQGFAFACFAPGYSGPTRTLRIDV